MRASEIVRFIAINLSQYDAYITQRCCPGNVNAVHYSVSYFYVSARTRTRDRLSMRRRPETEGTITVSRDLDVIHLLGHAAVSIGF